MLKRLYASSWNVAFRKRRKESDILSDTQTPFTIIKNNFRCWAADPFIVEHNGATYVFAELYDYVLKRGILGYCTISDNKPSKWKPIIKEPYHMSYPCIVNHDGNICIMPETGAGKVLSIYKATSLPDKWENAKTVFEGISYADTTPVPFPNSNFALTHMVDDPENPKLFLIDLNGKKEAVNIPYTNPFRQRPAGHFFRKEGKLIRPAQYSADTGDGYGKWLIFYECHYNGSQYSETEIREIKPEDLNYDKQIHLEGFHTYNSSENYEVIDLKTRRFNILDFIMRIVGKFI